MSWLIMMASENTLKISETPLIQSQSHTGADDKFQGVWKRPVCSSCPLFFINGLLSASYNLRHQLKLCDVWFDFFVSQSNP